MTSAAGPTKLEPAFLEGFISVIPERDRIDKAIYDFACKALNANYSDQYDCALERFIKANHLQLSKLPLNQRIFAIFNAFRDAFFVSFQKDVCFQQALGAFKESEIYTAYPESPYEKALEIRVRDTLKIMWKGRVSISLCKLWGRETLPVHLGASPDTYPRRSYLDLRPLTTYFDMRASQPNGTTVDEGKTA